MAQSRLSIQPRFNNIEYDVAVTFGNRAGWHACVFSDFLRDAVLKRSKEKGNYFSQSIRLFKLFCWAGRLHNRHKEALQQQFKSVVQVVWAIAVLDDMPTPIDGPYATAQACAYLI